MTALDVLVLFNEPALPPSDPDYASEAGVLESVEAVSAALSPRHRVRRLPVSNVDQLMRELSQTAKPDVVVNLFEGFAGVGRGEAVVTGLIELLGWPLTGSRGQALDLVRDKAQTKWLLAGAGLPTAPFELIGPRDRPEARRLQALLARGAAIVKPAHEDASLGIGPNSVVEDVQSLLEQIEAVRSRFGAVLVEQFIAGREFNVALLALPEPRLLPLAEIQFDAAAPPRERLVTYEAKWAAGSAADLATAPLCPAQVAPALAERIGQVAQAAFAVTGCRDYARVDMRVDAGENVFILEVNGNPDLGPSAGFARALRAAGIEYGQFVERLVQNAVGRG